MSCIWTTLLTLQITNSLLCFFNIIFVWNSVCTELLEKSLALLNKSQELTEFIEDFKHEGPNVIPELVQGAHSSCMKIDNLLEMLQDRRRQLDRFLKHQRQGLEQVLQIYLWHQQENQVTHVILSEITVNKTHTNHLATGLK